MAEIRHVENRHHNHIIINIFVKRHRQSYRGYMTSFFSAVGGPIWIRCRRLVQNDMSTAVMWSKMKPGVEFQYRGCSGKCNGMSSKSHMPHCRVLPPGEFSVMIPELRVTLQGVRIPFPYIKFVFCHILFFFVFNAV